MVTHEVVADVVQEASRSSSTSTRLHVSGLNPTQCSLDDIKGRFRSFGLRVSDVHNWPPKQNAVGKSTDWCFVTVEGDPSGVQRSMGLLNGTMWKGAKLRIGHAKRKQWQQAADGATEKEVEKERKSDERKELAKKRRRGIEGRQSDDIDKPVTVEDVEEKALWGWNKTRAGHLVRPMHMRPEHPLPRPELSNVDERSTNDKTSDMKSKPKQRSKVAPAKPLTRAKRITIDPSRYGATHISGTMMLENGNTQTAPPGLEWQCAESKDRATAVWTLKDASGTTVKQETVPMRPASDVVERFSNSDFSSDSHSDVDLAEQDEDLLAEINDAIDRAANEEPDSDSHASEDSDVAEPGVGMDGADAGCAAERVTTSKFPRYDPEDDDAFSDGYQEINGFAEPASQALDWSNEKSGQIDLLKRMFGAETVEQEAHVPQHPHILETTEDDDDDAGEVSQEVVGESSEGDKPMTAEETSKMEPATVAKGIARRAALLKALQPSSASASAKQRNHFQPIVRFDPAAVSGADVQEVGGEDALIAEHQQTGTLSESSEVAPIERAADRVEMDTLTDMFRPKEDSKSGFSLMADLDLDLDDDLNFEPDLDDDDDDAREPWSSWQHSKAQGEQLETEQTPTAGGIAKAPFLVPRYDATGTMRIVDGRDVFAVLMREQREAATTDELEASFYRIDDEATLMRKWEERKAVLTQAYKRRHREALKKKKRKFTGSRASGTALPGRRVT